MHLGWCPNGWFHPFALLHPPFTLAGISGLGEVPQPEEQYLESSLHTSHYHERSTHKIPSHKAKYLLTPIELWVSRLPAARPAM